MAIPANYRLGLDLGTTSIGWCLVSLSSEAEPKAIMRAGVRIFSDGRNPKDGTSLAVTRRLARQMRRRRDRLLKRKQRLLIQLVEFGFFPSDSQKRKELERWDPYPLRKKGLDEALSGEEFGRVIFHLNQRRGFCSNRKTDTKVSDSSVMKNAITELKELLEREECRTVGEWLADRHAKRLSVRARLRGTKVKDKKYDFYIDRTMVAHEFDVLWQKQQSFNSDLFSQAAHDALKDTLLYQRDLLPVEPGRCSLLPDEPRAPLALPLVQRFRIYQELNHLRLIKSDLKETELSLEQRDVLAAELEKRNLTFKGIRKLLELPRGTQFNLEDAKRKDLKGNLTSMALTKSNSETKKSIDPDWHDRTLEEQQAIVEQLLNEESEEKLIDWLDVEAGIKQSTGAALSNAPLVAGYGRLSRKAIERILPKLKEEVISYDKAVTAAGYASHSALSHAEKTGELMMELPYYGIPLQRHVGVGTGAADDLDEKRYGKIANPTVHVALNELRKVVNAIVRRYGHPNEIIVEVVLVGPH